MKPDIRVGDVVRHRGTWLRGRVKQVVQTERGTSSGVEPCIVVYVCLEPDQWMPWYYNEIERVGREGDGDAGR
jgi:hypothetical protein